MRQPPHVQFVVVSAEEGDDAEPTSSLAAVLIAEEDEPVEHGADPDDERAPSGVAPEAPSALPRAPARRDGDPETQEGGEARRARTGFRTALENQFLPWVNQRLNPDDRAELVARMRSVLGTPAHEEHDAVGLIALAHTLGQLLEQVHDLSLAPAENASYLDGSHAVMRWVPPQPDGWTPDAEQARRLRPKATHIRLDLPVNISHWLESRLAGTRGARLGDALGIPLGAAIERARAWLKSVRSATGGLQTLGRVEWWLPDALFGVRADHVLPHLICAINDGQPCPALYYRAYLSSDLHALHHATLQAAGWDMPSARVSIDAPDRWVGSNLNPELTVVKALWSQTTAYFEAIVSDLSKPLYVRHNARACHEALSAIFQTFHRFVADPIESLEFIDPARQRLVIDDKRQGEARAQRLVPMTLSRRASTIRRSEAKPR